MIELRASAAPIWANCPGSTNLEKLELGSTQASLDGELCHLLTYNILRDANVVNKTGLVATKELLELARGAADYVREELPPDGWMEIRLEGGGLPDGVSGTADYIGFDKDDGVLYVLDYKFGFSPIQAFNNEQLLVYSLGAYSKYRDEDIKRVELHIYQPRDYTCGKVKIWALSFENWQEEIEKLYKKIHLAKTSRTLKTGAWCRNCKSRVFCPAFLESANSVLESVNTDPERLNMSVSSISAEYSYLKRAEEFVKAARQAFEDLIVSKIEKGTPVPGWSVGRGGGQRYWSASVPEIKAASTLVGVPLTEEKPISIVEAWKNKEARSILETLFSKTEGKKKLIQFNESEIKETFK